MQGFATLLRRRLTLKIRASLKTQQKLFILHPTDLRRPYKLVVIGLALKGKRPSISLPRRGNITRTVVQISPREGAESHYSLV